MRPSHCSSGSALRILGLGAAAVLLGATPVCAQQRSLLAEQTALATRSDECCLMLLLPVGARTVSLGGATAARPSADAMFGNPAGLAALDTGRFMLHHAEGLAGKSTTLSLVFTPRDVGALAFSYRLLDHGDTETTDADNLPIGFLSIREQVLMGSFATPIGAGISAGLNYKVYQFRIDCRGSCSDVEEIAATTHGLDVGIDYAPRRLAFVRAGVSFINIGFPLQVVNHEQSDPLPTRVRTGIAADVLEPFAVDSAFSVWLSFDVETPWGSEWDPGVSVGAELGLAGALFVRAGYHAGEGLGTGASLGIGVEFDRFTLALAKTFEPTPLSPDGDPIQVSFGIRL